MRPASRRSPAAHVRDLVIPIDETSGVFALIDMLKRGDAAAAAREVDTLIEGGAPAR